MQENRTAPVLAAFDASDSSNTAVSCAATLARQLNTALYCVHAVEVTGPVETPDIDAVRRLARKHGVEPVVLVEQGPAAGVILAAASEWRARYIVIGTHGRGGVSRMLMGSVAERVMREATLPVITISPEVSSAVNVERIAVAVDGSAPAHRALLRSCELARACGGALELCCVIGAHALVPASNADATNEAGMLLSAAAMTAAEFGLNAGKHVIEGAFAPRISDFAKGTAQMIAIGTHARTGAERALLGSAAESLVRISPVPVLVVK